MAAEFRYTLRLWKLVYIHLRNPKRFDSKKKKKKSTKENYAKSLQSFEKN